MSNIDTGLPSIVLRHNPNFEVSRLVDPGSPTGLAMGEVRVRINPADRELEWMQYVVLLPWTAPQRVIGFVHPEAKVGKEPFTLFSAHMYNAQHGIRSNGAGQIAVEEGPKLVLPYDLIGPIDMRIHRCPSSIHMKDQPKTMQAFFAQMILQVMAPTKIELPQPGGIGKR